MTTERYKVQVSKILQEVVLSTESFEILQLEFTFVKLEKDGGGGPGNGPGCCPCCGPAVSPTAPSQPLHTLECSQTSEEYTIISDEETRGRLGTTFVVCKTIFITVRRFHLNYIEFWLRV